MPLEYKMEYHLTKSRQLGIFLRKKPKNEKIQKRLVYTNTRVNKKENQQHTCHKESVGKFTYTLPQFTATTALSPMSKAIQSMSASV